MLELETVLEDRVELTEDRLELELESVPEELVRVGLTVEELVPVGLTVERVTLLSVNEVEVVESG